MRTILLLGCMFMFSGSILAQYWIGPKVGYHYTLHDYQSDSYLDNYSTTNNHNFEAGLVLTYTASDRYAVHGELFYERIGNRVRSDSSSFVVDSKTTYSYLSAPILLRVSMGKAPVHWYLNAGPKISLWLGGKGTIKYGDDELGVDGIVTENYDVVFNRRNAGTDGSPPYWVYEANRIQYALTAGGGFYLDLSNGARMMFDFRYNWGHSNMGFNRPVNDVDGTLLVGNPINFPEAGYQENYEYTHNTMSFSIAYMFEYNTELKRKGGSTNKESRNNKKAVKNKKKSKK